MISRRIDLMSLAIFMVIAVALSTLWGGFAASHGLLRDPQTAGFSAWFAQLTVLVAALIAIAIRARHSLRRIGWRWGPTRAYGWVLLITVGLVVVASGVALLSGGLIFTPHITSAQAAVSVPFLLVLSCAFAFAEEFGWRGFLLPQLLPLGPRRALLVSGLCWFAWEMPLVVCGVLDSSMIRINLPLTLGLHVVQTVSVGIALGYLRLRFDSIALPSFAHGLLNAAGGIVFLYFAETNPFMGNFAGYVGTALLAALAASLFARV